MARLKHEEREEAIREAQRQLVRDASDHEINKAIVKRVNEIRQIIDPGSEEIKLSRRTVNEFIAMAQDRNRRHYGKSIDELAAGQLAILMQAQSEAMKSDGNEGRRVANQISKSIASLMGLNRLERMALTAEEKNHFTNLIVGVLMKHRDTIPAEVIREIGDTIRGAITGSDRTMIEADATVIDEK